MRTEDRLLIDQRHVVRHASANNVGGVPKDRLHPRGRARKRRLHRQRDLRILRRIEHLLHVFDRARLVARRIGSVELDERRVVLQRLFIDLGPIRSLPVEAEPRRQQQQS